MNQSFKSRQGNMFGRVNSRNPGWITPPAYFPRATTGKIGGVRLSREPVKDHTYTP